MNDTLNIADKTFGSRLFTGTGKFKSSQKMREAIIASKSELVTVALKRVDINNEYDDILVHLKENHINLLPNTSGVRTAKEAVFRSVNETINGQNPMIYINRSKSKCCSVQMLFLLYSSK